jgi:hypothetical protein
MAAGDRVFGLRYAKTGSTDIEGAVYASISDQAVKIVDPGDAAAPGIAEVLIGHRAKQVTIYAHNRNSLRSLYGAAAAAIVLGVKGSSGANEKCTLKSVFFADPVGEFQVQRPDQPGTVSMWGIRGECIWAADDTDALMEVWAAD